jgi:hypothetical protein
MARGGIEPPTPRFSVVCCESLELREIPGNHAVWLLGPDRQDHRKFRQIPADPGNDPPLVVHWRRLEVPEQGGKRGAVSLSQLAALRQHSSVDTRQAKRYPSIAKNRR